MTLQKVINVLVPLTLLEMMFAVGLAVDLFQTFSVLMNWRLVLRALLANYIFVPAITVLLLWYFHANPYVSIGFLILAICPGAPFGPPATAIAKGDVTAATALMLLLTSSSAIFAPLLLIPSVSFLLPDSPTQISAGQILISLLITQLLPLAAGLAARNRYPKFASKALRPANRASAILNLTSIIVIITAQFRTLAAIRLRGFLGMAVLLAATLLVGYLFAMLGRDDRKSMTLCTSLRNIGVGLVIANGSFAGTPALNAVIAYGLFGVIGSILLALAWPAVARAKSLNPEPPPSVSTPS
jgi:BASS family bile acid:Na+ symporter